MLMTLMMISCICFRDNSICCAHIATGLGFAILYIICLAILTFHKLIFVFFYSTCLLHVAAAVEEQATTPTS